MKKTLLLLATLTLTSNAFADFSSTIIGSESSIINKDFSRNSEERIHRGTNEIIFTFDDGPTPGVTNLVLDVLKEHNIKATFFVIAEKVIAAPALSKRIIDEGHIIANHSLTHKVLRDLSFFSWKKTVKKEIIDAHEILAPYMKGSKNYFYRAPEGAWDAKYASFLNQSEVGKHYIGPVLWDIGGSIKFENGQYQEAADWACWSKKISVEDCASGYVNEAKRTKGGVVLMHDLRSKSVEMLRILIPQLIEAGFTFKNLDDANFDK
jgi:peptidoglycan/xylan/chitin deacetylase (PgdA/CDA1 family)